MLRTLNRATTRVVAHTRGRGFGRDEIEKPLVKVVLSTAGRGLATHGRHPAPGWATRDVRPRRLPPPAPSQLTSTGDASPSSVGSSASWQVPRGLPGNQ